MSQPSADGGPPSGAIVRGVGAKSAMLMACDRVVVLDDGAVVEEGSPRELLATEGSYLQAMRIEDRTRSR